MSISLHRVGDWIQTFTRRRFWPLDPRPEDFDIQDIAHALSNLCRFTGHCRAFYSVAQHSVLVARTLEIEVAHAGHSTTQLILTALLHDAAEAYIGDMSRPLKRQCDLEAYRNVEDRIESAIAKRFDLIHPMPSVIKHFDNRLLVTEARDLLVGGPLISDDEADGWRHTPAEFPPLGYKLEPWSPQDAKAEFLHMFNRLEGLKCQTA